MVCMAGPGSEESMPAVVRRNADELGGAIEHGGFAQIGRQLYRLAGAQVAVTLEHEHDLGGTGAVLVEGGVGMAEPDADDGLGPGIPDWHHRAAPHLLF